MPFCTQFDLVMKFRLVLDVISAFWGSKYLALYIYKNNMALYSFCYSSFTKGSKYSNMCFFSEIIIIMMIFLCTNLSYLVSRNYYK